MHCAWISSLWKSLTQNENSRYRNKKKLILKSIKSKIKENIAQITIDSAHLILSINKVSLYAILALKNIYKNLKTFKEFKNITFDRSNIDKILNQVDNLSPDTKKIEKSTCKTFNFLL